MNKLYFLLVFFVVIKIDAQTINFNSSYFKEALLLANIDNTIAKDNNGINIKIDANQDGKIQVSEALMVAELDINVAYIEDIGGIEYFTNLEKLICSSTGITTLYLNALQELTYLDCSGNQINSLDISQLKKLETLACVNNRISNVNLSGLDKLQNLYISNNSLTDLNLSGLENLKKLECQYNRLTKLDFTGLTLLEYLNCAVNDFKYLGNFSDCKILKSLLCYGNIKLENLDIYNCESLEILDCRFHNISNLFIPELPKLKYLSAESENLTSIEIQGNSNIESLELRYSNLTTLDLTNLTKLVSVFCTGNKLLTSIFCKNGVVEWLDINSCFNLKYICADEEQFAILEDEIKHNQLKGVNYNSYCSFTPGGVFYTIQGKTSFDSDNNGCDSNDREYSNLNFCITNGIQGGNFISNTSGNYEIPLGAGNHTITPILENPNYFTVSPPTLSVTFPDQISPLLQDFCVIPKGNHQDLEITILPIIPARPGFDATYKLIYKNKGNQTKSGQVTLNFNDAVLDYVSSVPVPTIKVVNKLVWDYIDLQPFETREIAFTLNVNSPMETPAVNLDDRLSFNALITPVVDDEKPVDNSFALRQTVVGSYDPNDKTCLEGDVVTPNLIGEYVHYMIRFENTGNYPAENIVVKDMIDLSKFDISTLVSTKASHSYLTKISDGNKVEFIFEKINLPFDNAHNDGYIAFKIKTLPTLKVGDSFTNEANIFFDYNFPVLTNTASSTFKALGTQDFEFSEYVSFYPNPTTSTLNISSKGFINIYSMTIYNVLGQIVIVIPNAEKTKDIDVSKLDSGNYFIKIISDKGTSSTKFIKI